MDTKNSIRAAIIIALLGIAFVWMKGLPQTSGPDLASSYASSKVPAPGPNQEKIALKNLGMT